MSFGTRKMIIVSEGLKKCFYVETLSSCLPQSQIQFGSLLVQTVFEKTNLHIIINESPLFIEAGKNKIKD